MATQSMVCCDGVPCDVRLVERIRAEFEEMPGLSITAPQAVRLFGAKDSLGALEELVSKGLLVHARNDQYRLRNSY